MDDLAERKAALRAEMRSSRRALSPQERRSLGREVEARLFELPAVRDARTVFLFSSFGGEVPTEDMTRRLHDDGRMVLLPFVEGRTMEAARAGPGDALVVTSYGPREPPSRVPVDPGEIDVVVVPGVAFDRMGFRVGHGGGYYDRYLRRLRQDTLRVGIAFHLQLVPEVPHGPRDEPVDLVVTDRETIDCRAVRATVGKEPEGEVRPTRQ